MATVHHSPLDPRANLPPEIAPAKNSAKYEFTLASALKPAPDPDVRMRAEALKAARAWRLQGPANSRQRFAEEAAAISRQIGKAADRLHDVVSSGAPLAGDGSALLAHLIAIRTALRECQHAFRLKFELPSVQSDAWIQPVPRIYALSVCYLNAAGDHFDEHQFKLFAQAVQQESPLEMKELWNLRIYLEFALLEQIAGLSEHLRTQSTPLVVVKSQGSSRLQRCAESLRAVLDLDWKKLFEDIDEIERILKSDPSETYRRMDFETRDAYRSAVAKLASHSGCAEAHVAWQAVALASEAQELGGLSGRARARRTHVGFYLVGAGRKTLEQRIGYRPGFFEDVRSSIRRSPDYFYFISVELAVLGLIGAILYALDARPPALWPILLFFLAAMECAVMLTNAFVTSFLAPQKLPKLDFSKGIPDDCATIVVVPTLLTSETQTRKAVKDLEIRFLGNRDENLHFALLTDPPDSSQRIDDKDGLAGLCSELIDQLNRSYAGKKHGSFFHFHRPRTLNHSEGVWMGWERKRGKLLQFNRYLTGHEDSFSLKTGNLSLLSKIRYVITLDLDTQLPPGSAQRIVGAIAHPLNAAVVDPVTRTVVEGYGILQPRVEISSRSARSSRLASLFSGETGLDIYTRAVSDVYQDLFGEAIFSGKGIYELETFQRALDNRLPDNSILSHDLIESAYARAGLLSDVELVDDYPSSYSALNRRKHRWMRGDWQISPWLFARVRDGEGRLADNPINHVSRWKILDNLRRALTDMTIYAALLYAWFAAPDHALRWTIVLLGVLVMPIYLRLSLSVAHAGRNLFSPDFWKAAFQDWASSHITLLLRLTFLCHQALVELDAAARTLVRMKITHRRMLEWETAADSEASTRRTHTVDRYVRGSAILSVATGVTLAIFHPQALAAALPFVAAWALLPRITSWLDKPSPTSQPALSKEDRALVRNAGLRTWRFFREYSTASENWLVPDLVQQTPPLIAHRISTTNLGLLLNARLAAYDLGYLTADEFADFTTRTFEAVDRMPKWNGQLYNWYSTHTLKPFEPLFISTVDNGNLLCSLWTLKEGCWEMLKDPVVHPNSWQCIHDHVDLLAEISEEHSETSETCSAIAELRARVQTLSEAPAGSIEKFATLEVETAIFVERLSSCPAGEDIRWWASELQSRVKQILGSIRAFAPWLRPEYAAVRERLGANDCPCLNDLNLESCAKTYAEVERAVRRLTTGEDPRGAMSRVACRLLDDLRASAAAAKTLRDQLSRIAHAAQSLADGMDFGIFFDQKREMLAIGYDAGEDAISKWHYDLLPSEARSAAFGGIAQGTIPHKTWFRLGRFHGIHDREPMLYSWTGTMFEYLMPCLWTKSHPNSLLERSARAAIRVQRKFAEENGNIPWGVSECACNEHAPDGHYVYHAFGVPALALHRDIYSNDVVIAPYASILALMIEPVPAARNMARMKGLGWLGAYGFYDAADYTPRRVGRGRQHEIVRTWMAHHQGMSLVAISNALCDSAMQRRFHSDARVAAAERVLLEKAPKVLAAWEQDIVDAFRPSGDTADTEKPAA